MPPAVSTRGFGWRHAGRKAVALHDVTFDIQPGEKVLIAGPSGAGKSTLLGAIAGVLGGDDEGDFHGTLLVDGEDARNVDVLRGRVGLLLQDPDSQVIAARVGDDVAFGCENLGIEREEIWRRVSAALELVGLPLPLDHPTSALSGGQKQRLALAGIIAMGARVILLDEPTANIDPAGVSHLVAAVQRVVDELGATLIVVEHRVGDWLDVVDRAIVFDEAGRVRADGPARELLAAEASELARDGVWVPEELLPQEQRLVSLFAGTRMRAGQDAALRASQLEVGWTPDAPVGPMRDIEIPAGVSTVITGPNGAGKSTLALTLAGLLPALSGQVAASSRIANGRGPNPAQWSSAELAKRFGFVFQEPEHQFLSATVRDELIIAPAMAARRHPWQSWKKHVNPEMAARADELLGLLRLDHLAAASPFSLSGGQKRRLSVATALVLQPDVVFLDEPTFGQDRVTFIELIRLLQKLRDSGATMTSITHDELYTQLFGDYRLEVTR